MHLLLDVTVVVLVGAGSQLRGGRGGKDEDVSAGRILRRVQLRRLQVQSGAAAKHRAHGHCIWRRTNKYSKGYLCKF